MIDAKAIRDRARWWVEDPAGYLRWLHDQPGPDEREQARRAALEDSFRLEMQDRGVAWWDLSDEQQRRLTDIRRGVDDPEVKEDVRKAAAWFEHFAEEAADKRSESTTAQDRAREEER